MCLEVHQNMFLWYDQLNRLVMRNVIDLGLGQCPWLGDSFLLIKIVIGLVAEMLIDYCGVSGLRANSFLCR